MSHYGLTRVKEIFSEASELEPHKRPQYLDTACGEDAQLRAEVEKLLAALDSSDDILGRSSVGQLLFAGAPPQTTLSPGAMVDDRFRIDAMIGAGGMGEVYSAEDLRLGGRVAVKTLRSAHLQNPGYAARFHREIRLARRVTHPNVCRIFDIGRHRLGSNDILYLTMELLEGETLSARLRKGPVSPEETRLISIHIATGIAALHHAHVIHRDLKPSNVILLGDGEEQRAVITDFGLAHEFHLEPGDESLSLAGDFLGTPAYAAPEQLTGKKVGPQADIYALGLLMYEMLCGRGPFDADSGFECAAQKLTRTVEPPSVHKPLHPQWDTVVLGCLERDPERRISSAAELLQRLQALDGMAPLPAGQPVTGLAGRRSWLSRRVALWGAAGVIAVAVPFQLASMGRPIRRTLCAQSPGSALFCALPAAKDIAILPIQIKAGGAEQSALASGWAQYIRESFHRLAPNPEKLCVHLRSDRVAESVGLVMDGAIRETEGKLTLDLSIRESRAADGSSTPLVLRRITHTWDTVSVAQGYVRPLEEIAEALQLTYSASEWHEWQRRIPKRSDSAISYFKGLGYLSASKYEQAAAAFESILDPTKDFDFAPAHVGLGDAYRLMWNRDRNPAWELRARRSYERALPLDRMNAFAGANRSLGHLEYAIGNTGAAIEQYKKALSYWPFDHFLQKDLVTAYESAGSIAEAESLWRDAFGRTPRCWLPHNALGSLYSRHSRFGDAEREFLELIRMFPDNGSAYHNLAFDYIKVGRYDDSIELASKSLHVRPYPMAYSTLGRAFWGRGCSADALVNLRKAVELDPGYYILWSALADALHSTAPGSAEAAKAAEKTVELCRRELEKTPEILMSGCVWLSIWRAAEKPMPHYVPRKKRYPRTPGNQHLTPSAVEAIDTAGQRSHALTIVESALRAGMTVQEIEAAPGLHAFRQDSRYRQILKKLHLDPSADTGGLVAQSAKACPNWNQPGLGLRPN